MRRTVTSIIVAVLVALALPVVALADDPPKPNEFSLGLAFLQTNGNSNTSSGGFDFLYKGTYGAWGLEGVANFLRAEQEGTLTAERYGAGLRGTYAFSERWKAFAGVGWMKDQFAGLDSRLVLDGGAQYALLTGPDHTLDLLAGLSWTQDEEVSGDSTSSFGGVAGADYAWIIAENAKLTDRFRFYPSFEESNDWRVFNEFAIEAAIVSNLALKVAYQFRYDNEPVPGFVKTDTTVSTSLVLKF
jgi:putative salt-induced outer membrane protein